jgi:hypothetical protein
MIILDTLLLMTTSIIGFHTMLNDVNAILMSESDDAMNCMPGAIAEKKL